MGRQCVGVGYIQYAPVHTHCVCVHSFLHTCYVWVRAGTESSSCHRGHFHVTGLGAGSLAEQRSVCHRLDPSVGRQPCLHTPASPLIFIELTSLTELLEHLKPREEEEKEAVT